MTQSFAANEFIVDDVTVTFASGCDGKNATVTLLDSNGMSIVNGSFTQPVASNAVINDFTAQGIVAATVDDITITTAD